MKLRNPRRLVLGEAASRVSVSPSLTFASSSTLQANFTPQTKSDKWLQCPQGSDRPGQGHLAGKCDFPRVAERAVNRRMDKRGSEQARTTAAPELFLS